MFRTELNPSLSPHKISLSDSIVTVGSCFSDTIGLQLRDYKFNVQANPFGTIYNPLSIHKLLYLAIHNELPAVHTYLKRDEISFNYDFHSEFSAPSQPELQKRIANTIGYVHHQLTHAQWILITYGTAWVYHRNDTGEVVANCHKIPASQFTKKLLSQESVVEDFKKLHETIKSVNPQAQVIITLSPVRHLKDTLELNAVSKSILRSAIHQIAQEFNSANYFPAYEILLDDLRDYRYYKSDLLHPSDVAEEYIWQKFMDCYFDEGTRKFISSWKQIRAALSHKPFHPQTASHQRFLKVTLKQVEELKSIVNVDEELQLIKSQLL
ncbi:MAG: GSCFA domain-containing protein [Flammeovirgaceae bacterium]|nr:GSCFA domain-containing protein [Flammeovirgaceae bacterium]